MQTGNWNEETVKYSASIFNMIAVAVEVRSLIHIEPVVNRIMKLQVLLPHLCIIETNFSNRCSIYIIIYFHLYPYIKRAFSVLEKFIYDSTFAMYLENTLFSVVMYL